MTLVWELSSTLGPPRVCAELHALLTHDCSASYPSNLIIKYADDTTVLGLITDNKEMDYGNEVQHLPSWCDKSLVLNTKKTKQIIATFTGMVRSTTELSSLAQRW